MQALIAKRYVRACSIRLRLFDTTPWRWDELPARCVIGASQSDLCTATKLLSSRQP